jgi:hypothetical protein
MQVTFEVSVQVFAQAAGRGEAGHLDIAYAVEGFEPVLLRVVRLFRQLFPMVELGIREMQYHQQVQELIHQRIDIGYVGIRFPELESELVFECVRKAPFLVSGVTARASFSQAAAAQVVGSVLHAFLEMLRDRAHAEAQGPEKTAGAKHSDSCLQRRSQREVGAAKSAPKSKA